MFRKLITDNGDRRATTTCPVCGEVVEFEFNEEGWPEMNYGCAHYTGEFFRQGGEWWVEFEEGG